MASPIPVMIVRPRRFPLAEGSGVLIWPTGIPSSRPQSIRLLETAAEKKLRVYLEYPPRCPA